MSARPHQWDEAREWLEEYDHPLWKEMAERSAGAGHGGMDYMEDYRLIKCLREGIPTDMNVYDAAAISAVTPLERMVRRQWRGTHRLPGLHPGQVAELPGLGAVRCVGG